MWGYKPIICSFNIISHFFPDGNYCDFLKLQIMALHLLFFQRALSKQLLPPTAEDAHT